MTVLLKEKIEPSERIKKLIPRYLNLIKDGKRDLYFDGVMHGIYQWSPGSASFVPATGEFSIPLENRVVVGDHDARVGVGYPFPGKEIPSSKKGLKYDPENWAEDFEYFLENSPAEIYPNEYIVGEFHWRFDEARKLRYPEEIDKLGKKAMEAGSGGGSLTHTCPDLSIGLSLGWHGILNKVIKYRKKYEQSGDEKQAAYLRAAERTYKAVIKYIQKYAQKAKSLAEKETDEDSKENYLKIAQVCENISVNPPSSFREAVQWIELYQIVDRMIGHGNGYGRLDQLLKDFYIKDINDEIITRQLARDLVAEIYLKYGGSFFALAGRDEKLKDATNELSWVCLEAYEMIGEDNGVPIGVMWHSDIDKDFFKYACEVLYRHGAAIPTLVNYDVARKSEIYSGVKAEDAWNVSYSGCQWYCIPGKEYCDQDKNCIVIIQCFLQAFNKAAENNIEKFEDLWNLYCTEVENALIALRDLKDAEYKWQPLVWPEIVGTSQTHGCIEAGKDITDTGTGIYNYTSVNILGLANVVDSLFAIKKLVFEDKKITLRDLQKAVKANFIGFEQMRQEILKVPKYGNDEDEVDFIAAKVANHLIDLLKSYKNSKGFHFRPSLFMFMGHALAGPILGATPDGRKKEESFAQGGNPMHGRSVNGITATMNSMAKLPLNKVIGGPLQFESDPSFFAEGTNPADTIEALVTSFFEKGGIQVNLNIVSIDKLRRAQKDPLKYYNIVIRVTGYTAHFVNLDKKYQEDYIKRTRFKTKQ